MVGNENFSNHLIESLIDHKSKIIHTLITQERYQQLELLTHLLSNSKQAIVICGPEGIGKSTFLSVLQKYITNPWIYCRLQGKPELNFERIKEQAVYTIKQNMSSKRASSLDGFLELIQYQNKNLILVIDDSGQLPPGAISGILDYAESKPNLRVVLALTHEDLFSKYTSDSKVDDCHLIEIPALSEPQCRKFLHAIASKQNSKVRFNLVSDEMLEAVYLKTQGIPKQIIAELPGWIGKNQNDNSLRILIAAVFGLIILALLIQWFSASEYNLKQTSNASIEIH